MEARAIYLAYSPDTGMKYTSPKKVPNKPRRTNVGRCRPHKGPNQ